MSLRYRLFLWVSGLFVVVAVFSYFLENFVTRRELAVAQKNVRAKMFKISENRRMDIERFVASSIAETEVKIDATLNNISAFTPQMLRFGPTVGNEKNGTWQGAVDLLFDNKWIDFLQNTNESMPTATLIPGKDLISNAYRIDIDQDFAWIYLSDLQKYPDPFFAVKIPYVLTTQTDSSAITLSNDGKNSTGFLLFDLNKIHSTVTLDPVQNEKNWPQVPMRWNEKEGFDIQALSKAFSRGMEMLSRHQLQPPQLTKDEVQTRIQEILASRSKETNPIPIETLLSSAVSEKIMAERFKEISLRNTKIGMIWTFIAICDSGVFGHDLFSSLSPSAISFFPLETDVGVVVNRDNVLFATSVFNDAAYYKQHAPPQESTPLATSLSIIPSPILNHVYFGNTVQLQMHTPKSDRTGYLTIGVDADRILQQLVQAIDQTAILVSGNKPLTAYRENGAKLELSIHDLPFLTEILHLKSGIVDWNGENYFFLHMQPFNEVDLHFILLNPEAKEFEILNDLEICSEKVANSILFNIHIIGLVVLTIAIFLTNNISKKITGPIVQLAKAASDVGEGRLDQVKLDLPPLQHQDEITVLCHSFEEMVKGLQEKEKVQGVLNKVVSRQIAQEILKGTIHLGGEEKDVTVLFADIRDFTKITQNMLPHEVVDILNTCMTKISHIIDKNSGVIDKYVGDEAMALFGAPIAKDDAAFLAVKSAVEMVASLESWNQERTKALLAPIEMGIGIHSGKMLVGNMGAENRLNYTVIGSRVNLVSRLCGAAKRMEILITKDTLEAPLVKEHIIYEELPPMSFKGIDLPVAIFRVKGMK